MSMARPAPNSVSAPVPGVVVEIPRTPLASVEVELVSVPRTPLAPVVVVVVGDDDEVVVGDDEVVVGDDEVVVGDDEVVVGDDVVVVVGDVVVVVVGDVVVVVAEVVVVGPEPHDVNSNRRAVSVTAPPFSSTCAVALMRVAPAPGETAANLAVPFPPPPVPIAGATWNAKAPVLKVAEPLMNRSSSRVTNSHVRLSVLLQPVIEA
jgi:hypothetical protein